MILLFPIFRKNRSALSSGYTTELFKTDKNASYYHWVVTDGVITGSWKAFSGKNGIGVKTTSFGKLNKDQQQELITAVKRYTSFWDNPEA